MGLLGLLQLKAFKDHKALLVLQDQLALQVGQQDQQALKDQQVHQVVLLDLLVQMDQLAQQDQSVL
jgi:hypothetical protein